jgi:hypothetical protein
LQVPCHNYPHSRQTKPENLRHLPVIGSGWLLLRVASGWNQGGTSALLIGQAAYPALRREDADSPGNPAAVSSRDLGQKLCVPPFRMVCPVTNELECLQNVSTEQNRPSQELICNMRKVNAEAIK